MKKTLTVLLLFISCCVYAQRRSSFDKNWRFIKQDLPGAEQPIYDDSKWRQIDLPHDWSIEDLPDQKEGSVQGPFTKFSVGKAATGFTEGGVGWYRKSFTINNSSEKRQVYITFDGIYEDADVWVNGTHLGNHPYGYTSFSYNITKTLNPAGQNNIIAVRAKNLGNNSRWYAGSGIYRHVWLSQFDDVHTEIWGTYVTTPMVSTESAEVKIENTLQNASGQSKVVNVKIELVNPSGQVVATHQQTIEVQGKGKMVAVQQLKLSKPELWDLKSPKLYQAKITLSVTGNIADRSSTNFGIRSLQFDGEKGFLLNGKVLKLRGGCIHHDNGPLGAVSNDRAEERKIELLKKAGFNALRLSHNPVAPALLDACDRLGMLVVTDSYDSWEKMKSLQGNHLFFKEWWKRDLESMIVRDRNHPSIIMWGIGNEIWEAADTSGHRIAKQLAEEVRRSDPTRPVTEAIVYLPPLIKNSWDEYEPHLANLDVDGYNYFVNGKNDPMLRDSATQHRYETEHAKHPKKLYMATEYFPEAALENWEVMEKYPFVIGGFTWTAMDYIGEANIGGPKLVPESMKVAQGLGSLGYFFTPSWPIYDSNCGALDIIGNPKAAFYYQRVVWSDSRIEMLVHRPLPNGMKELRSPWGFADLLKSWSFPGNEGNTMQVFIYSRAQKVKLELNGKLIGEQTLQPDNITARFDVPYQAGILIAKSYTDGKQTGADTLKTVGKPYALRLKADRKTISASRNDLSYVNVEVVDEKGNVVPYVDDLLIKYHLEGRGEIAGVGNGNPADMSSFQLPEKKVYHGRGLVIIRPLSTNGKIILNAGAQGLKASQITIDCK